MLPRRRRGRDRARRPARAIRTVPRSVLAHTAADSRSSLVADPANVAIIADAARGRDVMRVRHSEDGPAATLRRRSRRSLRQT